MLGGSGFSGFRAFGLRGLVGLLGSRIYRGGYRFRVSRVLGSLRLEGFGLVG